MQPYVSNIYRPLMWQHNNAHALHSLLKEKDDWYTYYHTTFWSNWKVDVFDLKTASPFGLLVWCHILGMPAQAFVLFTQNVFWAYGPLRQNYYSDPAQPNPPPFTKGGNFFAGDDTTILTPVEARMALRMRYYQLISPGTVTHINHALEDVFGTGNAWVSDNQNMTMQYTFKPGIVSDVFVKAVLEYDLFPSVAGVKYTIQYK